LEARHNYLRKVSEDVTRIFITDNQPNVHGLIVAGSADFKTDLVKSDLFDDRLQPLIIKIVDIAYGGEEGFYQAIELSSDELSNVTFVKEKKLLGRFMTEVATDSMKYASGLTDVMKAMEMGAAHTVILWENLALNRYVIRDASHPGGALPTLGVRGGSVSTDEETQVVFANDEPSLGKIIEMALVTEWFAENYQRFGTKLEYVTDRSQEGAQFCHGFGGVGALLRYKVDFLSLGTILDAEDQDPTVIPEDPNFGVSQRGLHPPCETDGVKSLEEEFI
jgi:peptide chain release factor subunit 1